MSAAPLVCKLTTSPKRRKGRPSSGLGAVSSNPSLMVSQPLSLRPPQVNLLADLCCWTVTDNADAFRNALT